ncbi:hypothetical protein EW093_05685 [Thiospirochaeta perfilievii]|uniref:Uncharacterized protein n=1 Tax=Thiospirochaeta perfilievii TaxID=252967 RepID=A0A5C1QC19_9SPIO|nr:hypothetical protein [Thiospirochaeta perfilievii]QEN04216.1 hypothetical protein EW093_05685 [Thiospirochaeta perfilievii]
MIFTPTSSNDDGYILLDTIISLLILTILLANVYGLVIKGLQFKSELNERVTASINKSLEYDEQFKNL